MSPVTKEIEFNIVDNCGRKSLKEKLKSEKKNNCSSISLT